MSLDEQGARSWLDRWDRQQEFYLPDREERFAVIADVVAAAAGRPDPVVLDIGCGPGSLSARIHARLPAASIVGVDSDPLLLGLARAGYPWLPLVDHDLRDPGWIGELPVDRPVDAVVSTTALHWLFAEELEQLYAALAGVVRPGGVFVNGDHMPGQPEHAALRGISDELARAQAGRAGVTGREDWRAWWDAVETAPELADLVAERGRRPLEHNQDGSVGYEAQVELLRKAGFAEAGSVWQFAHDRILVAVR